MQIASSSFPFREKSTMRAVLLDQTGPSENLRLGDAPIVPPGPGEIRVNVKRASINPIDLYIRSGTVPMALPMPFTPGCDFAGVVEEVGSGVEGFRPGQRVWGSNQGLLGRQGTLREQATIQAHFAYPSPEGVSDDSLAAAALTGITAHLALFANAQVKAGDTVVIQGGTGGVGSMAIQMAKAVGARVITTVRSEEKAELALSLGAEKAILFGGKTFEEIRAYTGGKGVDAWIETQREPDFLNIVPTMAPRGRIVILAGRTAQPLFPVGPFYVKGLSLKGFAMFNATPAEQAACAVDISRWLAEGALKVQVGQIFDLDQAVEAHRYLEENTLGFAGKLVGKVLVRVS
jgi:NADPH2:quinone reductase